MSRARKLLVPIPESEFLILMNTIVMSENEILGEDEVANSVLLWENYLNIGTTTSASDSQNVINLYDQITSQKWNPGSGTHVVQIDLPNNRTITHYAIASHNMGSSGTVIEVYRQSITPNNLVGSISGIEDNVPKLIPLDVFAFQTSRYFIRFIATGDLSIGQFALGQALEFPTSPSLGMELGKFNNNDKENTKTTEGNEFAGSTISSRLRNNSFPFEGVPFTWIRENWVNFSDNHKGGLVWMLWEPQGHPDDTVFGYWSTDNINYTSSLHTTIRLKIEGHVE